MRRGGVALAAVVLLSIAGCAGRGGDGRSAGSASDSRASGGQASADAGGDGGATASTDEAVAPAPLPGGGPVLPVSPGDKVVKDGTVTVEVAEDGFEPAFQAVVNHARALGGFVVASTSQTSGSAEAGAVTVRVPVDRYEDLLTRVADVGRVIGRNITSQDVTVEVVDLDSRLRHLQAQEGFYLQLIGKAQSVGDAIAVQEQLEGIQSQMEQIKGRLQLLADQTSFSTLTVQIGEPGAPLPGPEPRPTGEPSLARYWETAQHAFVNAVGALLVVVLFLVPLAVLVGLGCGVAWWLLRRRRGGAQAAS